MESQPGPSGIEDRFKLPNEALEQLVGSAEIPASSEVDANLNKEGEEQNEAIQNAEQTTLLQNEEESFALAPVDASALRGTIRCSFWLVVRRD